MRWSKAVIRSCGLDFLIENARASSTNLVDRKKWLEAETMI